MNMTVEANKTNNFPELSFALKDHFPYVGDRISAFLDKSQNLKRLKAEDLARDLGSSYMQIEEDTLVSPKDGKEGNLARALMNLNRAMEILKPFLKALNNQLERLGQTKTISRDSEKVKKLEILKRNFDLAA